MGTRSNIGKWQDDGTITAIYCHWDGYPQGVGKTLVEHYADPAKIDALLALGDLSTLGEEIGEKQDFEDGGRDGWCLAYGRDRGETGIEAKLFADEDAYTAVQGLDYQYLWRDGRWFWRRARPGHRWATLLGMSARED